MGHTLTFFIGLVLAMACSAQSSLELFPNYHTVGINVQLSQNDPEKDAWATVEYSESGTWEPGFPLSRVDNELSRLGGSLFWCEEGTTYNVRVTIHDSTTAPLDQQVLTRQVTTRVTPQPVAASRTYYVSPAGSGSSFALASPGNLQDALDSVKAGERVVLLEGAYYVGGVTITNSGQIGTPIVIEGAAGAEVLISGRDTAQLLWQYNASNEVWTTQTTAVNPNLVFADGQRLYPHRTLEDFANHRITVGLDSWGNPVSYPLAFDGFYRNPSTNPALNPAWMFPRALRLKFVDGADPQTKDLVITKENVGLELNGNKHIVLRNLRFSHYGLAPAGRAIEIVGSDHIMIDSCDISKNDIGVLLADSSSNITIQNTTFSDDMWHWNSWHYKNTYDLTSPYSDIFPFNSRLLERGAIIYEHGFSGRGIVTRGCTFHDYAQAGHIGPASIAAGFEASSEIDFYDNTLTRCAEMEIDNVARNVRVFGCTFGPAKDPLSLAVAKEGPIYIFRNVFHTLTRDTFIVFVSSGKQVFTGVPLKFQSGDADTVGDIFFLHNTIYARSDGMGMDIISPPFKDKLVLNNNLFVSDDNYAMSVQGPVPDGLVLNHNGYYSSASEFVRVDTNGIGPGEHLFNALADLTSSFGWEANGLYGDPRFTDSTGNNFHLSIASPAIDAGQVINGINDKQFAGSAPDLGAFESGVTAVAIRDPGQLDVRPVPSKGLLVVAAPGLADINVSDMQGRVVRYERMKKSRDQWTILVGQPGLYCLSVRMKDDVQSRLVLVVH